MALDKVIDSAELDANLAAVADAIRTKGGTSEALSFPDGFVSAVEGIQAGGGGDSGLESLIAGTLTDFYSEAESVARRALSQYPYLESVNMPNCVTTGYECFAACPALKSASLPKITELGDRTFWDCSALESVNLPRVTKFVGGALRKAKITQIPNAENVTYVGGQSFMESSLTEAILPNITFLGDAAFQSCNKLVKADLGAGLTDTADRINLALFNNCTVLETVILRKQTMHSLRNISSFSNTPIANGTGYIYVPRALVDSYKTATNWSTFATQFRAIEDYPEICGEVSA